MPRVTKEVIHVAIIASPHAGHGIQWIQEILPHRYPFLLVDRIEELEPDRIVGIKNVTINEPFFPGHFPDFPVMPGVLIIESMAQVAGVLVLSQIPDRKNKLVLLASVEEAKFRRPVRPGDQLRIEMKVAKRKATLAKMFGTATVAGVVVAEADDDVQARRPRMIHRTAIVDSTARASLTPPKSAPSASSARMSKSAPAHA